MFKVSEIPEDQAPGLSAEELYSLLFQPEPSPDWSWMDRPRPKKRALEKKFAEYLAWQKKEVDNRQGEELEDTGSEEGQG